MEACSSKSSLLLASPSPRSIPKLRLCASISTEDIEASRCQVTEQHIQVEGKNYSRTVFDHILRPDDLHSAFLADTIQSVFAGNDATVLAMGAKANGKDEKLYGDSVARNGLVQMAITELMNSLDEKNQHPGERIQVRMSAIMVSQKDSTIMDLLSPFNPDPRHREVKLVDDARTGVFIDNESEIRVETIDQALFYLNTAVDHRLIQDEHTHRTSHVFISLSLYSYKMGEKMEGGRRRLCFLDMGIGERHSSDGMTMPALGSILLAMVQRNKHIPSRDSTVCQLIRCALGTSRLTTFLFSFGAKSDDNENIAHLACKIARTRSKTAAGHGKKASVVNYSGAHESSASSSADVRPRRFELESGSELSAAETVIFLGPSSSPMPSTPTSIRPLHRTTRKLSAGSSEPINKPLSIETKTSPTHACHDGCIHSIPPMLRGHTPFLSESLKLYDVLCSPPGRSSTSTSPLPSAFGGNTAEKRDDFGIMIAQPASQSNTLKNKSKCNLDDGKMKQIMQWMETSEAPPMLFSSPCYENGATSVDELRECVGILSHPLEDIIEIEEESLRTSTTTGGASKKDHPLRILSKQDLNADTAQSQQSTSPSSQENNNKDKEELELVMAASLSSMRSHDILAKLEAMRNAQMASTQSTDMDVSEMDVYRRASHLEEYAMQRVREIEENKQKSKQKKMKLGGLNCCQQQSMISSGSTVVDWSQIERKKEKELAAIEEEKRKEVLRERRAKLKITELELKRERNLIDKELDEKKGIANSIARQLQHFSLSPCRGGRAHRSVSTHRIDPPNASLPSTPTMSHKKVVGGSLIKLSGSGTSGAPSSPALGYHQSLPRHSKLPTAMNGGRRSSSERKSVKTTKSSSRERRSNSGSKEELQWRSPYAQMTSPKTYGGPGTSSSGRGSSAPGSDFEATAVSATATSTNGTMPRSKRQSYSASSGYESANDYHIYATTNKKANANALLDRKKNEEKLSLVRQVDEIRHRQRQLKKELEEAKRAIGQEEDAKMIANSSDQRLNGLSRTTMIDAMLQENRILEKRLIACRNHSMLVTTFI